MKKAVIVAIAAAALVGTGMTASAETVKREGVFLGAGGTFGAETGPFNTIGGGAVAEVGYGFHEKAAVAIDTNYFYTKNQGVKFNFFDTVAKAKYYPVGNLFLTAGGGLAVGRGNITTTSKLGWAATSSVGYEIPVQEQMDVSLEGGYKYRRIKGTNYHSPLFNARLGWHF
jgi:hypothetical protein